MKLLLVLLGFLLCSVSLPPETIYHLRDASGTHTITSVKRAEFTELHSENLGVDNGAYWFKINNISQPRAILELQTSHVTTLELYDNNGTLVPIMKDTRFPSYFISKDLHSFPLYLKGDFPLEAFFPITISNEGVYAKNDRVNMLGIGFFYGTSIALLIATLIFFFIVKNTKFIFFAFIISGILLSVIAQDNILNFLGINIGNTFYLEALGHYSVGLMAMFFMVFYLKLRSNQQWIKWSIFSIVAISTFSLFFFIFTEMLWGLILVNSCSILATALLWILILRIAKGPKRYVLSLIYSVNLFFLVNVFVFHLLGITLLERSTFDGAGIALLNFTLIAVLLLLSFYGIQTTGVIMKHKIKRYVEELKELNTYRNIQDTDDDYLESLIYQFKLENIEVKILDDIAKGLSNEAIASKYDLTTDRLNQLTKSLYTKLGLETSSDLQNLAF